MGARARRLTLALGSVTLAACQVSPVIATPERIATAEFPRDADRLACLDEPADLAVATTRTDVDRLVVRIVNLRDQPREVLVQGAGLNTTSCGPDAPRWSASHALKVLDAEGQVERPTIRLAPHGVATVTVESLAIDLVSRCERLELVLSVHVEDRRACLPAGTWVLDLDRPHLSTTSLAAPAGIRAEPQP
jgi:hypothetical protein